MKKRFLAPALLALSILTAQTAFAQTYSYQSASSPVSYAICTNLTQNLSLKSRSADVTKLQSFLLAQNYPGSGSWMVTGYFGTATRQAVLNFQSQRGLAQSGIA